MATQASPHPVIEVRNLTLRFGGFVAVDGVSIEVRKGSITGLIGPNGAGKSTLFNMVAGTLEPTGGTILLEGEDVTGLPPHRLFRKGVLRTFQIAHEFSRLTVLENLMMVPPEQPGENLFSTWLSPARVRAREREVLERAEDVIDFLKIGRVRDELAGNLSGGQKKLVELGRTMMVDAKVVLLDEIAAGVNRTLLNDVAANIERLNQERGYTFFVIEHDMDLIGRLCDPVIVMAAGSVMMKGSLAEIQRNEAVVEAYFGGSATGHATAGPNAAPAAPTGAAS